MAGLLGEGNKEAGCVCGGVGGESISKLTTEQAVDDEMQVWGLEEMNEGGLEKRDRMG